MEVRIQGTHNFTVSNKMRDYINRKVEKLNYFKSHIHEINFHLSAEKLIYKISATLSIPKFGINKFEVTASEMYTAIDKIIHKMDVKILREKTKIQDHSNLNHEEVIHHLYDNDLEKNEPLQNIPIATKATTLADAYMQMELNKVDCFGFYLIDNDESISIAFLRKLEDDVIYLFKKHSLDKYKEYALKKTPKTIKEDSEIRDLALEQMTLEEAKESIFMHDYPFNIYLDENKKICFLYKVGNGKWQLIS